MGFITSSHPLLERMTRFSLSHDKLSASQLQMDSISQSFTQQASNPQTLLAMTGAGMAFRFARMASLSLATPFLNGSSSLLPFLLRSGSYGVALASESLAFTGIQRAFESSPGKDFSQEYLQSILNLASLKLFTHLSQGQNIFIQHFLSDTGIVSAHALAVQIGLEEKSQEDLTSQFVHAEVLNWQMKAGMGLLHFLTPQLARAESFLDVRSKTLETSFSSRVHWEANRGADMPVFAAQNHEHTLPFNGGRRKYGSTRPAITSRVIRAVTRNQPREEAHTPTQILFLRRRWLNKLPHFLQALSEKYGKEYGFVFLPGMYNHAPDPDWMNLMSTAFHRGGTVISTALGRETVSRHGLYSILGENEHVLQPHWEIEVAIVIRRMALALEHRHGLEGTEKLVILGHSKGGLLTHALQVLSENYQRNGGHISPYLHDVYPGLDNISPENLRRVMTVLRKSRFVLLGSPVEGVPYTLPIQVADYLLLEGSAQGFDEKRLAHYFQTTRLSPDEMDIVVHAKMPGLIDSLRTRHPGTPTEALAYKVTGVFFYGVSFLMGARSGDALIRKPKRVRHHEMRGRYNHVDIVVHPHSAIELLEIIFQRIIESEHNSSTNGR